MSTDCEHIDECGNYCSECGASLMVSVIVKNLAEFKTYIDSIPDMHMLTVHRYVAAMSAAKAIEIDRLLRPIASVFYVVGDDLIPLQFMMDEFAQETKMFDFHIFNSDNWVHVGVGQVGLYFSTYGGKFVNEKMGLVCEFRKRRMASVGLRLRDGYDLADVLTALINA